MSPERRDSLIGQFARNHNGILVTANGQGFACLCCERSGPFAHEIQHAESCVLSEPKSISGVGCIGLRNGCDCSWCAYARDTQAVALGLV